MRGCSIMVSLMADGVCASIFPARALSAAPSDRALTVVDQHES
jgi:hypothetical protein